MKVFKILTLPQWEDFQKDKIFKGSEIDLDDGFIHLSFSNQWENVWKKFFNNSQIILLEIKDLDQKLLKIEANKPGGDEYPHYYGHLTIDMVADHTAVGI